MKVSKINKFFRRIGEAQIKHRKLCLIILFAVTLICLSGMRNFRSESSNSDWIVNGSEIKKNSDHFKEVFGNDQYVLVLVQADDVFAPDVLNMIDRLGERLEYAARLLQENDLPISQAAQLSGYTNMSHFSKSFIRKFGVLPKDY